MESMCGLHGPQRCLSKRQLPPASHRSDFGCLGGARNVILLGRFLGIPPDPYAPPGYRKDILHHTHGLYCYNVMPFGLKNDGATYQRLVTKMFRPLLGGTMEVYIDDMLVKSKQRTDHATHLQQAFDLLRKYDMKLLPFKMCLRGQCRPIPWLYSNTKRNRGKSNDRSISCPRAFYFPLH